MFNRDIREQANTLVQRDLISHITSPSALIKPCVDNVHRLSLSIHVQTHSRMFPCFSLLLTYTSLIYMQVYIWSPIFTQSETTRYLSIINSIIECYSPLLYNIVLQLLWLQKFRNNFLKLMVRLEEFRAKDVFQLLKISVMRNCKCTNQLVSQCIFLKTFSSKKSILKKCCYIYSFRQHLIYYVTLIAAI